MIGLLGTFSTWEILVVLVVALLLFGKRLPEVARSMGKGIVEFKRGLRGVEDEIDYRSSEPSPKIENNRREYPTDTTPEEADPEKDRMS